MAAAGAIIIVFIANLLCWISNRNNYVLGKWISIPCLISSRPFSLRLKNTPSLAEGGYWLFKGIPNVNPQLLITPVWGPSSDWIILVYRFLTCGYFAATLITQSQAGKGTPYKGIKSNDWMQYYTNDTFCLIPLYALLGIAFHVSELAKRGRGQGHSTKYGPLSIAFHLVYQTCANASLMLTAFYWLALYDPKSANTKAHKHDNRMRHGFNLVIIGFDLLITRTPFVGYHFHATILWTTYYAIFMWIFWGVQDQWVYDVLDWRKSGVYYVAIPLLMAIAFFIWLTIAIIRAVIVEAFDKRWGRDPMTGQYAKQTHVVGGLGGPPKQNQGPAGNSPGSTAYFAY